MEKTLKTLGLKETNEGCSTGQNWFSNGEVIESYSPVDGKLIGKVKTATKADKISIVNEHIDMVKLTAAADKYPDELSGGMKQRVGVARALATRPKMLLLDEPFGALDALTRPKLQQDVLEIWGQSPQAVMMITHDVDEAIFMSDRVVMMTNGPGAKIGKILDIPLPRPRDRYELRESREYYELRNQALDFLERYQ